MTLEEFLKQFVKGLELKTCIIKVDSEDFFRWDYREGAQLKMYSKLHVVWISPRTNLPKTITFDNLEYMVDVSGPHLKLILI